MNLTEAEMGEVQRLYEAVLARGGAGCCWHVVLDDRNIEDSFVRHCIEESVDPLHGECVAIGPFLLKMSKTQRVKLVSGGYKKFRDVGAGVGG